MTTAANVTYLGEPEAAPDAVLHWRVLDFPIGTPVLVDPDAATMNGERIFFEHVLLKTKNNPHFTVEEVTPASRKKSRMKATEPGQPADDDYPEEEENGDTTIPPDFRDLHHKKIIALAKRLGGEGDDLATRDGAIAYIEEVLALGGVPKPSEKA
jgi:hypothetical protein